MKIWSGCGLRAFRLVIWAAIDRSFIEMLASPTTLPPSAVKAVLKCLARPLVYSTVVSVMT